MYTQGCQALFTAADVRGTDPSGGAERRGPLGAGVRGEDNHGDTRSFAEFKLQILSSPCNSAYSVVISIFVTTPIIMFERVASGPVMAARSGRGPCVSARRGGGVFGGGGGAFRAGRGRGGECGV
jgi:hypothetical protein